MHSRMVRATAWTWRPQPEEVCPPMTSRSPTRRASAPWRESGGWVLLHRMTSASWAQQPAPKPARSPFSVSVLLAWLLRAGARSNRQRLDTARLRAGPLPLERPLAHRCVTLSTGGELLLYMSHAKGPRSPIIRAAVLAE